MVAAHRARTNQLRTLAQEPLQCGGITRDDGVNNGLELRGYRVPIAQSLGERREALP
jgi:hypothetical protein